MDKSEIQERIIKVVCQVLNTDKEMVEPSSNFVFDLGAESTQSVQLVAAFEEEFGFLWGHNLLTYSIVLVYYYLMIELLIILCSLGLISFFVNKSWISFFIPTGLFIAFIGWSLLLSL